LTSPTSHLDQLSLALPPYVGAMSTSKSWEEIRYTARMGHDAAVARVCGLALLAGV